MLELRLRYLKKIQLAMLSLGFLGVNSFFLLFFTGQMVLPKIILAEATLILLLIIYSFYRIFRKNEYDEFSTNIILLAFFVHCIVVYFLVSFDPLRVIWFQVLISLVFLFKDLREGVAVALLSIIVVFLGNETYFSGRQGEYDVQLLWTFIVSTTMISGAAGVMSRYYQDLAQLSYNLSRFDGLTGVLNSRAFRDECSRITNKLSDKGETILFGVIDLDDFKNINDTRGHPVGDEILVSFSHALKDNLTKDSAVGRIGGDEFVFIEYSDSITRSAIFGIFKNILQIVSDDVGFTVQASLGISKCKVDGFEFAGAYRDADHQMYTAKRAKTDL